MAAQVSGQKPVSPFREELGRGTARLIITALGLVMALGGYVGVHYLAEALDHFDEKRSKNP